MFRVVGIILDNNGNCVGFMVYYKREHRYEAHSLAMCRKNHHNIENLSYYNGGFHLGTIPKPERFADLPTYDIYGNLISKTTPSFQYHDSWGVFEWD